MTGEICTLAPFSALMRASVQISATQRVVAIPPSTGMTAPVT